MIKATYHGNWDVSPAPVEIQNDTSIDVTKIKFFKRRSDGVDFYAWRHQNLTDTQINFNAVLEDGLYHIKSVARGLNSAFPENSHFFTIESGWESGRPLSDLLDMCVTRGTFEVIPAPKVIGREDVDHERDRRIAAGFGFQGYRYQSRAEDIQNISGSAQAAFVSMSIGEGTPGNFRWADPDHDFEWITETNFKVKMDAPTVFNLGKTAMSHKQKHIFAAFALKDLTTIPTDFDDDKYWPST